MIDGTISHYQILEMLGERKMDPSLKPRSPGGAEIATENAPSLQRSGLHGRIVDAKPTC